ncbi:hypothetical protein GCM10011506_10880 [Marivirga lumbricoides]|uniref:Ligand-binding SRPBCC domain-containing protein n=1 Tax=Marivirga lumbricoides TaxID=1046115 RepID=A0A2T4DED6_9BACT|nr:hypothetical protein C9994_14445 [Marivirga lumbricoides]GGC27257.1 hypothetical protein GCM10011506_10880 [Marivirga lumbricoides]
MHLKLSTKVKQDYLQVKEGFNSELFMKLNPPFPPVDLLEFGGSEEGDKVHLRLNFLFFKQDWISLITFNKTDEQCFEFIDEGTKLPFFLKKWKHHHIVKKSKDRTSIIVDDVHFRSPFLLMDFLLYPILWLQFAYRKPVYKRIFK